MAKIPIFHKEQFFISDSGPGKAIKPLGKLFLGIVLSHTHFDLYVGVPTSVNSYKLTFGIWHCSERSLSKHLGGFSKSSTQLVLSVNLICENSISSCLYCKNEIITLIFFIAIIMMNYLHSMSIPRGANLFVTS